MSLPSDITQEIYVDKRSFLKHLTISYSMFFWNYP